MFEPSRYGEYEHPSFAELQAKSGSGYYVLAARVGFGGIFYLSSRGVTPLNPEDTGPGIRIHDVYDVLRAVEQRRVFRMEQVSQNEKDS